MVLVGLRRALGASAAWLALAIAGFGAALTLIDAPPAVAYQHYRLAVDTPQHVAAWVVLGAQLVALVTVGRATLRAMASWVRRVFHPAILVLLVIVAIAFGAAPSRDMVATVGELTFVAGVQLAAVATVVCAVRSLPDGALTRVAVIVERVLGDATTPAPTRPDRWVMAVAVTVVVIGSLLAWVVYERHPHVPDEVIYLLHARYLAEGMLTMPLPPVPSGIHLDLMHYEATRWYSPVPPGWPFVLAVGAWFGAPWLVNPMLAGLAIVLAYLVLGGMYDRRTARLATLLLAGSPWFLFMAMNFMTHMLTLVCALLAALGVARTRRGGSAWAAFGAGLATGAVSLIRPLEGLAVAMLMGLWSLGARGRRFRFAPSAALVVGSIVAGTLVRPYNAMLTGAPSEFPIMAYIDKYYAEGSNDMGFGPNRGLGWSGLDPFPGHGPIDVVVNAVLNLSQINVELLGWPVGAVLLLALALAPGPRSPSRADWWQVAVVVVVAGLHSLYWFSGGPDFGARYWFLVIVPCVTLVARALLRMEHGTAAAARGTPVLQAAALVFVAVTLAVYVPWRSVGKYRHYRGMRPDVRALARAHQFGESLVLVRGRRHPDYASAAVYNPIDLRAPAPVYAWDASPAVRTAVLDAWAGRPVWILDGPSLTGDGFRVVAGPLTTDEARVVAIPPSAAGDDAHVYDPVTPPSLQARP